MPSLVALAGATECVLAVTQPDRPAGRGQKLQPTPVKARALELGISVAGPARLSAIEGELAALKPDIMAVASYGRILSQRILDLAPLGALNVHPSLLPLYRGATPLQAQLRDGVTGSGVTIILMDAGMDTGDIVLRGTYLIGPDETYGELHDRLAELGAKLLRDALAIAAVGPLPRLPQQGLEPEESVRCTATKPLSKADLEIDWSRSAKHIVDHVRSLSPEPLARARFAPLGEPVKVIAAAIAGSASALVVPCGAGETVAIERVIPPSRGPMSGAEFGRSLERVIR